MNNDIINECYKELCMRITYESIEEFIEKYGKEKAQNKIIKELKSPWMKFVSNGLSIILAEKLETNPAEICDRVKRLDEEDI